jgi:hypothetical protein
VSATTRQGNAEAAWYQYEGTYKSLPSVKIPVVVTNGALDVVNPPANAKLIADRLPRASVSNAVTPFRSSWDWISDADAGAARGPRPPDRRASGGADSASPSRVGLRPSSRSKSPEGRR